MSSATVSGLAQGLLATTTTGTMVTDFFTVQATVDDWMLPAKMMAGSNGAASMVNNVGYWDLNLGDY